VRIPLFRDMISEETIEASIKVLLVRGGTTDDCVLLVLTWEFTTGVMNGPLL
jgi:hypothetical protein